MKEPITVTREAAEQMEEVEVAVFAFHVFAGRPRHEAIEYAKGLIEFALVPRIPSIDVAATAEKVVDYVAEKYG